MFLMTISKCASARLSAVTQNQPRRNTSKPASLSKGVFRIPPIKGRVDGQRTQDGASACDRGALEAGMVLPPDRPRAGNLPGHRPPPREAAEGAGGQNQPSDRRLRPAG